jgi:hypothetical protein
MTQAQVTWGLNKLLPHTRTSGTFDTLDVDHPEKSGLRERECPGCPVCLDYRGVYSGGFAYFNAEDPCKHLRECAQPDPKHIHQQCPTCLTNWSMGMDGDVVHEVDAQRLRILVGDVPLLDEAAKQRVREWLQALEPSPGPPTPTQGQEQAPCAACKAEGGVCWAHAPRLHFLCEGRLLTVRVEPGEEPLQGALRVLHGLAVGLTEAGRGDFLGPHGLRLTEAKGGGVDVCAHGTRGLGEPCAKCSMGLA